MSTQKSKEELVRLAWIAALRREGHRKCTDAYHGFGGAVCALGLLAEVVGEKVDDLTKTSDVGSWAGLDFQHSVAVINMNDGENTTKCTFSEIADVIEGWFK